MKIVAIKCPSCKGSGKFFVKKFACMWCEGKRKLRKEKAIKFANQTVMLAYGGFICGDLDWEDRKRMLAEADYITNIFNEPKIAPDVIR